jgi:Protein of unknown function (DUF3631)
VSDQGAAPPAGDRGTAAVSEGNAAKHSVSTSHDPLLARVSGGCDGKTLLQFLVESAPDSPPVLDPDGAALLSDVQTFVRRFCAFPDQHALAAVTVWAAHAHMVQHFHTTPRLALLSPEVGSGKTRVLEVLDLLVPQSMFCLSASPAAIFRTLSKDPITLLVDECDTIFTRRGKDDSNEDLRALLNAGYKRGATIPRCVGPKHDVQNFAVFCATVLAGLGDLPDTIMSRSVIIRMRRRAPGEHIEPFRTREHAAEGHALRERIARWAALVGPRAGDAWPTLPDGIVDRPAEIWEPLLAAADAAGGDWPQIARDACIEMCKRSQDSRVSLGVRLLADLRTIFGTADAMTTEDILGRLCSGTEYGLDADAPWSELHGKPLGVRGLASMLKRYGVSSLKVKVAGRALQGYRREHLWDAWVRYLSPVSVQAEPVEPAVLAGANGPFCGSEGSGNTEKVPDRPSDTAFSQVPAANGESRAVGSIVPVVPEVPLMRGSEKADVLCRDCRHFTAGTVEGGLGMCRHFDEETYPAIPFECKGFAAAASKSS